MAMPRPWALIGMLLFTAPCQDRVGSELADARPEGSRAAVVTHNGGVTRIVNLDPLWDETEGWEISTSPVLQIGDTIRGLEPRLFSMIEDATRLPDGRIVMVDGMTREVRAFSPTGEHVWTVGGLGDGPGEFSKRAGPGSAPVYVQRVGRDGIQVGNSQKRVRYGSDGQVLEDRRMDWGRLLEMGAVTAGCGGYLRTMAGDTNLLVQGCTQYPDTMGLVEVGGYLVMIPWSFERVDTLGWFDFYQAWGWDSPRGLAEFLPFHWVSGPWTKRVAVAERSARLAYATTDRYRILVYDLREGVPWLLIERPEATRPPTASEIDVALSGFDQLVDTYAAIYQRSGYGADYRGAMDRAREHIPDSVSPIDLLLFDDLDYLWVAHRVEPGSDKRLWAVFRDDGMLLGHLDLPLALDVLEIGEDYILGVMRDELDVSFLTLFSLRR